VVSLPSYLFTDRIRYAKLVEGRTLNELPLQPVLPRWNPRSIALIVLVWLILHIGGLFTPGLLDDVDSVYIEVARQMLHRHDFVTPTIDGIRFFDKPPLMYWLAAGSMAVFGETDWAARLPLALSTLALLFATYALALELFKGASHLGNPDRAAFYSALALATSIGPYLYTRFFIPDILIALWMTLAVHCFLVALTRIQSSLIRQNSSGVPSIADGWDVQSRVPQVSLQRPGPAADSALLPCLLFAAVTALDLLTKGLIGVIFPIGFVLLCLAFTRQLRLLTKFHLIPSTLVFLAIAAPWHILAALRNPPIALPPGLGLPARGGWAWFYLYNEHIARFLSRRIPHDYGQTPVWLFWLLTAIWLMPWTTFLPVATPQLRGLWSNWFPTNKSVILSEGRSPESKDLPETSTIQAAKNPSSAHSPATLTLFLWPAIVLIFFTLSARQEYYALPALPALALIAGAILALAECTSTGILNPAANRAVLTCHRWLLLPLSGVIAIVCAVFAFTAPHPPPGANLATLLSANPEFYNLSLGHLFDLTGAAMGLFRTPLALTATGMLVLGLGSYILRAKGRTYAANLAPAAGMTMVLLAAHAGLVRFNPILGSKDLALAIVRAESQERAEAPTCNLQPATCNSIILIDGELTSGSTLLFYTRQPVHLVDARVNGLWYGSFWPDAPAIFEDEASLRRLWAGRHRIFLLTYHPAARSVDLSPFGPVHTLASGGGKSVLTNR
jgi:4-amino-4-deoxy-L-arabinose transferase-like glycosyltransferase